MSQSICRIAGLCIMTLTAQAYGQLLYSANASSSDINPCGESNSLAPVYTGVCIASGGCAGTGGEYAWSDARSDAVELYASTRQTRYGGWNSCGGGWRSQATASWDGIIVIFTGPSSSVLATMNVNWQATWTWNGIDQGATIRVNGNLANSHNHAWSLFSLGNSNGVASWSEGGPVSPNAIVTQIGPDSWQASGVSVFRPFPGFDPNATVPINSPIHINASTNVDMHQGDFGSGSRTSFCEVRVGFPTTSPVFNLPPGYSAYSTDGRIVDNRWVDPRPVVIQQPSDAAACRGNATFSITGAGDGTLSYQWRKDTIVLTDGTTIDGSIISGASTATLSITGATEGDEGLYDCIISNSLGTATSNTAALTVCAADLNCDTGVDFFDYLDFVDDFSSQSPAADFNGDGDIDFFDYLDFVDAFSIGC